MNAHILHGMMVLLGIMLVIAYFQIVVGITDIKSKEAQAASGIYTLGIIFISVGATLLMYGKADELSTNYHTYLTMALGIVLIVLGSILVNKLSGTPKTWSILVVVIGILFVIGCSASLYQLHGDSVKRLLSPKFEYGCGMY